MSEEQTAPQAEKKPSGVQNPPKFKEKFSRRTLRALGRKKRKERILADREYATKLFEGRSKRSNDKKSAFRKRHGKKGATSAS